MYFDEDDDYEDEEDEELEDEDLYQLVCPTCEEEIIVDEDVLAKGSMKCPACGEELEFDTSALYEDEVKNPKFAQMAVKAYLQREQFAADTTIEIGCMEIGIYE